MRRKNHRQSAPIAYCTFLLKKIWIRSLWIYTDDPRSKLPLFVDIIGMNSLLQNHFFGYQLPWTIVHSVSLNNKLVTCVMSILYLRLHIQGLGPYLVYSKLTWCVHVDLHASSLTDSMSCFEIVILCNSYNNEEYINAFSGSIVNKKCNILARLFLLTVLTFQLAIYTY